MYICFDKMKRIMRRYFFVAAILAAVLSGCRKEDVKPVFYTVEVEFSTNDDTRAVADVSVNYIVNESGAMNSEVMTSNNWTKSINYAYDPFTWKFSASAEEKSSARTQDKYVLGYEFHYRVFATMSNMDRIEIYNSTDDSSWTTTPRENVSETIAHSDKLFPSVEETFTFQPSTETFTIK